MTKTSTLVLDATNTTTEKKAIPVAEPSAHVLQTILNYSRNLEIRSSEHVSEIQFLKS